LSDDFPERWSNYRAISRDAFLSVGGYDDVGYGEDMTLAPKLGVEALAAPGAVCWHFNPDSISEIFENARWIARGHDVRAVAHPVRDVASANHMLEYSSLLPRDALLRAQEIPHCLSFSRHVFEVVGHYPEDTVTGEDTLFNRRCVEAGISFGFSAEIQMEHIGLTSIAATLRHAANHGQGLMQCTRRHELGSSIGDPATLREAAWRALVRYPTEGVLAKARRLGRYAPDLLPELIRGLPVIVLALVATGAGALAEWQVCADSC
jgi:hypothetical protein